MNNMHSQVTSHCTHIKKSPLGFCVQSLLHAGLHLSSQRCIQTQQSHFELSPHVCVMQLLAQLLRYFPTSRFPNVCSSTPSPEFLLTSMTQTPCGCPLPVKDARVKPNYSFIVILSLVCGSHLPLSFFCLATEGDKTNEISASLLCFSIQA